MIELAGSTEGSRPSNASYAKFKAALSVINNPDLRAFVSLGIDQAFEQRDYKTLKHALALHSYPVSIEEFMFGETYLVRPRKEVYPVVLEELITINEGFGRVVNTLTELVAVGSIGCAKTTLALYTIIYQLYLFSCYKNPHQAFGLDSASEIVFIFQSLKAKAAVDVDYKRFRALCEQSYYFNTVFPFTKDLKSSLVFPHRIECKPISADMGSIGQNVVGGVMDEVNFMSVTTDSRKVHGGDGIYDQAKVVYDAVSRRIKTRFVENGGMPGLLALVSSRNYPGEFTDVKIREAATDPSIYVYDKVTWEVKPKGTFSGEMFPVFVGDDTRKPRTLTTVDGLNPFDRANLVKLVPVEYRSFFERDIGGALKDMAGVAVLSSHPFMLNTDAVAGCFGKTRSIFNKEEHDFSVNDLEFYPSLFKDPDIPRWVHADLAVTGDAAGLSCGYCQGFVRTSTDAHNEEVLPRIVLDFILRILPPKNDEIRFYKIRDLINLLRDKGLNIKWVSFDTFQSVDSVQLLRSQGFVTGFVSMDKTMVPYEFTKNAFYDGRIVAPAHAVCKKEILTLERTMGRGSKMKIDHPPNGSKDCADALSGVVYGLTSRREVWSYHGIPIVRIPDSIKIAQESEKARLKYDKAA